MVFLLTDPLYLGCQQKVQLTVRVIWTVLKVVLICDKLLLKPTMIGYRNFDLYPSRMQAWVV